jgi:predicted XRE-type DNA-binding protein
MAKRIEHTLSSGNVFADLGLPDADEQLAKAEMAVKIARLLEKRKLTQKALADLLGASQSDVSLLANHKFGRFSTERLMQFLVRLGQDVEITIKARTKGKGCGVATWWDVRESWDLWPRC